jgi:hypothetical protein
MADIDIRTFTASGTPALVHSGKGQLTLQSSSGNPQISGVSGTPAFYIALGKVYQLTLTEDTDVYVVGSGALEVVVAPLPNTATLVVDCG